MTEKMLFPAEEIPAAETEPYRPSNGTEGEIFMDRFCNRCKRDDTYQRQPDHYDSCPILAATFRHNIDDPRYPKEWVRNVDSEPGLIGGCGARCTAFELIDQSPETRA